LPGKRRKQWQPIGISEAAFFTCRRLDLAWRSRWASGYGHPHAYRFSGANNICSSTTMPCMTFRGVKVMSQYLVSGLGLGPCHKHIVAKAVAPAALVVAPTALVVAHIDLAWRSWSASGYEHPHAYRCTDANNICSSTIMPCITFRGVKVMAQVPSFWLGLGACHMHIVAIAVAPAALVVAPTTLGVAHRRTRAPSHRRSI
jgi:hypothetical protein